MGEQADIHEMPTKRPSLKEKRSRAASIGMPALLFVLPLRLSARVVITDKNLPAPPLGWSALVASDFRLSLHELLSRPHIYGRATSASSPMRDW
jgi:hypothetical protein